MGALCNKAAPAQPGMQIDNNKPVAPPQPAGRPQNTDGQQNGEEGEGVYDDLKVPEAIPLDPIDNSDPKLAEAHDEENPGQDDGDGLAVPVVPEFLGTKERSNTKSFLDFRKRMKKSNKNPSGERKKRGTQTRVEHSAPLPSTQTTTSNHNTKRNHQKQSYMKKQKNIETLGCSKKRQTPSKCVYRWIATIGNTMY